ncbi:MAG: hypothetical protein V4510_12870 [bacterium]
MVTRVLGAVAVLAAVLAALAAPVLGLSATELLAVGLGAAGVALLL